MCTACDFIEATEFPDALSPNEVLTLIGFVVQAYAPAKESQREAYYTGVSISLLVNLINQEEAAHATHH